MSVYLLHFSRPLHHARHYIGFSTNPALMALRTLSHRTGKYPSGKARAMPRILSAAAAAGITFEVVRTWGAADRGFERRLKRRSGGIRRVCPHPDCGGEEAWKLANYAPADDNTSKRPVQKRTSRKAKKETST